jgi:hypothetical protein
MCLLPYLAAFLIDLMDVPLPYFHFIITSIAKYFDLNTYQYHKALLWTQVAVVDIAVTALTP